MGVREKEKAMVGYTLFNVALWAVVGMTMFCLIKSIHGGRWASASFIGAGMSMFFGLYLILMALQEYADSSATRLTSYYGNAGFFQQSVYYSWYGLPQWVFDTPFYLAIGLVLIGALHLGFDSMSKKKSKRSLSDGPVLAYNEY